MEREGESARVCRSRCETRVAFNEDDQRPFLNKTLFVLNHFDAPFVALLIEAKIISNFYAYREKLDNN